MLPLKQFSYDILDLEVRKGQSPIFFDQLLKRFKKFGGAYEKTNHGNDYIFRMRFFSFREYIGRHCIADDAA